MALGKLEGRSDAEIFQDAVLQSTLSLSMQAGTAAHTAVAAKLGKAEFTASEAQTALKAIFREEVGAQAAQQTKAAIKQIEVEVVAEHLSKGGTLSTIKDAANARLADLQGAGSQLKARLQTARQEIIANYGKDNRLVTREQMQAARANVARYWRESFNQANIAADPSVLADYAKLATGHIEAGARSLEQFATAMRGEAAAQKKTLTDAELQQLYTKAADEYLTSVKAKLSPKAAVEFEQQRAQHGDETFLLKLPDNETNTLKKFEGIAANKAKQANEPQRAIEQQAKLDVARIQIERPEFVQRKSVQRAIIENNSSDLAGYIGVELAKQKLSVEYPASKGYEIQEGVLLYKDSGFKTKADWEAAHPGMSSEGVVEMDGKAWQKATDADLLIVRKNATGKYEIAQVEQIKAGKQTAGEAKKQLDVTTDALQKISNGDQSVRIVDKRADRATNITSNYDLTNLGQAKAVTRGADDRQHYDATIGLTRSQIKQLAEEIITKQQAKGGN